MSDDTNDVRNTDEMDYIELDTTLSKITHSFNIHSLNNQLKLFDSLLNTKPFLDANQRPEGVV
jgi:hypothetical protein